MRRSWSWSTRSDSGSASFISCADGSDAGRIPASACSCRPGRSARPGAARLAAIERETSGFRIAEIDLSLRGAGEVMGTRQSGLPDLRAGDLVRDRELFELARAEAFGLVEREGSDGPTVRALVASMRPAWRRRLRLAEVG
jgi:RecG-like helicase